MTIPAGLARDVERRRQITVNRVREAIAALKARGEPVSLRRITAEANVTTGGSRLTESVIERNSDAYALYEAARPPLTPRTRIRTAVPERGLERMTKDLLIARIQRDRRYIRQLETALASACGLVGDPPS